MTCLGLLHYLLLVRSLSRQCFFIKLSSNRTIWSRTRIYTLKECLTNHYYIVPKYAPTQRFYGNHPLILTLEQPTPPKCLRLHITHCYARARLVFTTQTSKGFLRFYNHKYFWLKEPCFPYDLILP